MTDTEQPRTTGEQEPQNGRVLLAMLKKWGIVFGLIVGGGAAWQTVRSCALAGGEAIGFQTTAKAEKAALENVEAHNNMWQAIGRMEEQTQEAADYSKRIYKALPKQWRAKVKP